MVLMDDGWIGDGIDRWLEKLWVDRWMVRWIGRGGR